MSPIRWRWQERDLGFRFRAGAGRRGAEHYQAAKEDEYYIVGARQGKLSRARLRELAENANVVASPKIVPNPWKDYERDWDWIVSANGILLNYAGCLDQEEVHRREDEGVARASEYVANLVGRPQPATLTVALIQRLHEQLMGAIYPFAGQWRTVALHKGDGPTRWPLPPNGIQPLLDVYERYVLSRAPFLSDDNDAVYLFASEVMNELLAIHPFREGNGRLSFIVGNLILMQNNLLPLAVYDRRRDRDRYYAACDAGRVQKHYEPLALLIAEWEDRALERWEATHGA